MKKKHTRKRFVCTVCGKEASSEKQKNDLNYNIHHYFICRGNERGEDFMQHIWREIKSQDTKG